MVLSLACSPPLLSGERATAAFAGDVAANRDDARRAPPVTVAAPPMADEDGAASAADEEFLERRALIADTRKLPFVSERANVRCRCRPNEIQKMRNFALVSFRRETPK